MGMSVQLLLNMVVNWGKKLTTLPRTYPSATLHIVWHTETLLFISTLFTLFPGGNEPRLIKAATEQLNKLPFYHSFWNRTTKPSLVMCIYTSFIVLLQTALFCWLFSVSNFSLHSYLFCNTIIIDITVNHSTSTPFFYYMLKSS
jgi:hypothetical protein